MGKWREQGKETWLLIWPVRMYVCEALGQSPDLTVPLRQCLSMTWRQLFIHSVFPILIHLFSHSLVCCVIPCIHQIKSKGTKYLQDEESFHSHEGV